MIRPRVSRFRCSACADSDPEIDFPQPPEPFFPSSPCPTACPTTHLLACCVSHGVSVLGRNGKSHFESSFDQTFDQAVMYTPSLSLIHSLGDPSIDLLLSLSIDRRALSYTWSAVLLWVPSCIPVARCVPFVELPLWFLLCLVNRLATRVPVPRLSSFTSFSLQSFFPIFNFFQFPISSNFQFLQISGFIAGFPAIPSVHPIEPATGHATRNPIYSDLSGVARFSTVVILCTPHQLHRPITRPSANPPNDESTSIQRLVLADLASASDRAALRVTAKETAAPGPTSAE